MNGGTAIGVSVPQRPDPVVPDSARAKSSRRAQKKAPVFRQEPMEDG
jgi:hypothetical protein